MKPRLRFKGFTDNWKKTRLSSIAKVTMGQSPLSKNYTKNPKDYLLVQGNADLGNGTLKPRLYTTQITKTSGKGDIILTVRAPVGETAINNYGTAVIGRGVANIKGNYFLYTLFQRMKLEHQWDRYSTGSTFHSINSEDIRNLNIFVPSLAEQHKIGKFFYTLDKLIALGHKDKASLLRKLKLAYLQKMFC